MRRGTRRPAFRVVRAGTAVPARDITRRLGIGNRQVDDAIDANGVLDRYRRGDTVVLQGLHHTDPHLAELANNLALALDHPVQINAYLSPPETRGLDLHFDFHDVFVVQLTGSKRWRVWSPLPRTTDPVKGVHTIDKVRAEELGTPLIDTVLRPGHCLYVPRGHPHAAETIEELSDHLTIGLLAVTWQRVLRRAVDAAVADGHLTGALPLGLLDGAEVARVDPDVTTLSDRLSPVVLRHWLAREIWRRQPATRLRPRSLPAHVPRRLDIAPGPLLWLTEIEGRAVLGLGDSVLDLPGEAHPFLAELFDAARPIAADTLRGLDDDSRQVVLRRLVAEGVLVGAG
jgi:lysine-specific demethylase/histidyl-hydroxylase NO66